MEQESEGQQVAVIGSNGETVYVQLPPNVTLDGENSIVSSEVTEDGQHIFRILGVAETQDCEAVVEGDVGVEEQIVQDDGMIIIEDATQPGMGQEETMIVTSEADVEEGSELVYDTVDEVSTSDTVDPHQVVSILQPDVAQETGVIEDQLETVQEGDDNVAAEDGDDVAEQPHEMILMSEDGVTPVDTGNQQDLALFQQALTLLHQQSGGQVIVRDEDNTIYIMQQDGEQEVDDLQQDDGAEAAVTDTVNIINPETGDFEAVPTSSLDTLPDINPTEMLAPIELTTTPITVTPQKRRPGRPRKNKSQAIIPVKKEKVKTEIEEPVVINARGQPRRKAAMRLLRNWEAMRKDDDTVPDENVDPSPVSRKPYTRPSGRRVADKENMSPQESEEKQSGETDQPASVCVTLRDSSARQVLGDIGIHMLYYCRRCTFYSTQLPAVITHIHECREQTLTDNDLQKAADALLLNASLQKIAGTGHGNIETTWTDKDLIEIDEHNYAAEVDIVTEDSKADGVTDAEQVECGMCGELVDLSQLDEHVQLTHADMVDIGPAEVHTTTVITESDEYQPLDPGVVHDMGMDVAETMVQVESEDVETEETAAAVAAVITAGQAETELETDIDGLPPPLPLQATEGTEVLGIKFRCPQHELLFTTQAALTKHYIEVHWEVTQEKVDAVEKQKEERQEQPPPLKRGRGRPPKIRPIEPELYDDDVEDPDYMAPAKSMLPLFSVRPNEKAEKCVFCYKYLTTAAGLERHIAKHHSDDKLLPVPCTRCNKLFRNSVQLRNHVRTVHDGKKRKPTLKKYKYSYKRKTHMCELCGYTTPEKCRLRNHMMSVHEGNYPYKCDKCDYKSNENADFKRHLNKHQGIKRYKCHFCTYRTDQRWTLVNHCQRQHAIQLEKQSRNTRGGMLSNHRRRKDGTLHVAENHDINPHIVSVDDDTGLAFTQEIVIEQGMDFSGTTSEGYSIVPMVTTNEHGEEEVMYTINNAGSEEQVAIETIQEETHGAEVVYIQEDGTVLDQDQAALMLLAVGPDSSSTTQLEMDSEVPMETTYT